MQSPRSEEGKTLDPANSVFKSPESPRAMAGKQISKVYIIDHLFALNQIDFIENCDTLTNVIVPDTVLRQLHRKNIQTFHGLRNTLELNSRQFYYFYNENFRDTFVDDSKADVKKILDGKGLDWKL